MYLKMRKQDNAYAKSLWKKKLNDGKGQNEIES